MVVLQEGDPSKEISSSHISFLCLNKAFVAFHCFSTSVQYSIFFSYLYNFKHSDFKSLFFNTQALWINSSAKRNEHIRIKTLSPEVDVDGVVLQFPRNIRALKKLSGNQLKAFLEVYGQLTEGSVKELKNRFAKFMGLRVVIA
jgi:hypothetical protein